MKMNFSQLGQYQGNYLRNTIFLLHLNVKDEDVNYIKREQKTFIYIAVKTRLILVKTKW